MTIANFLPTVWSAKVLQDLEKNLIFGNLVSREFQGEVASGNTVKINTLGTVTVQDYTKDTDLTVETLSDTTQSLLINQNKATAFQLDDVDAAQSNANLLGAATSNSAYVIADSIDSYIAGLYAGAGTTYTDATFDKNSAMTMLTTVATNFRLANVSDSTPKWVVVDPYTYNSIFLAAIALDTDNSAMITNGYKGTFMGMDIYVSNNVVTNGAAYSGGTRTAKCMAGTYSAIAMVTSLTKVAAFEQELRFNEGVKMLAVFGAKVVRPAELQLIDLILATEV